MLAISLWQPWASLIFSSAGILPVDPPIRKHFETRSWRPIRNGKPHWGPLLIHAARRVLDAREFRDFDLHDLGIQYADYRRLEFGKSLGIVELVDDFPTEAITKMPALQAQTELQLGNFSPGRRAWQFEDPRAFEAPWHLLGRQGLFEVPDAQIAGHALRAM